MTITIVVIGAIFGLGALVLGKAFQSYDLTQKTTDVDWQGRVALERMVREMRQIRSATINDLDLSSGVRIWFVDKDGKNVCFYLDGTTSQLIRSDATSAANCSVAAPNPQPLADNVTGINFDYYDNTGAVTAVPASVWYIAVRVTVSESSVGGNISETYRVSAHPRRF